MTSRKALGELADRFCPNTALKTTNKEDGYHQTDESTTAFCRFPQP
jgi:hypothetical protein